jgi:hypothetical protein
MLVGLWLCFEQRSDSICSVNVDPSPGTAERQTHTDFNLWVLLFFLGLGFELRVSHL